MNLAPIRYARIWARSNGPVERMEYGRIGIGGAWYYQANAHLSRHLNLQRGGVQVFGGADGTGTDRSTIVARHKAISESIERWAYYYVHQAGMKRTYGFDRDSTTAGMAAYPGLWKRQARKRALEEAVERYCLANWWGGHLDSVCEELEEEPGGVLRIENPLSRHTVVVIWKRSEEGLYAYGFGTGTRVEAARWKAIVEMERSLTAMRAFHLDNPGFGADDLAVLDNYMERRMMYYSMPSGHREFIERVGTGIRERRCGVIRPIVDTEIKGPWTRYATVWRVLYPVATIDHLVPQLNTFYW